MPRHLNRLSNLKVTAAKSHGLYADGGGLYLQVAAGGSKSWIFRYKRNRKARDMGLGRLDDVSLANARERAAACRKQHRDGHDPIELRNAEAAERRLKEARATTFDDACEAYISAHETGWRNAKHRQQWRNTLIAYASPIIGDIPVADVDTDLVLHVLQQRVDGPGGSKIPLWNARSETASRVRGRIEAVLDWAKARGLRTGENPARWRGHVSNLLPKRSKVRRVRHHPALPYADVAAFMKSLQARDGISARALEFTILTAWRWVHAG